MGSRPRETDSPPSGAPPVGSRPARTLLFRGLLAVGAVAALLFAAALSLRLPPVGRAFANLVLGRLPLVPGARLSTGETRGDWFSGVEFRALRLAGDGITYVAVDTMRLRYDPWALLRGQVHVRSAELAHVVMDPRLLRVPRPAASRPRDPLSLDDWLRGRFYAGPRLSLDRVSVGDVRGAGIADEASLLAGVADSTVRLVSVRLEAREVVLGRGFAFEVDTLGLVLRAARGARARVELTSRAALHDGRFAFRELRLHSPTSAVTAEGALGYGARDRSLDVGLRLQAEPLDLADLSAFVVGPDSGAGAFTGLLRANADLQGPSLDSLSGTFRSQLDRGRIARVGLERLVLALALDRGRAEVRLDAVAEDAPVTVHGWARPLDAHPASELRLRAGRLPARLPGLPWWPTLASRSTFAVEVATRTQGSSALVAEVDGTLRDESSTVALRGKIDLSRGFAWKVERLGLEDVDLSRLATGREGSRVNAELAASGERSTRGRQRLRAQLELGPSSYGRRAFTSGRARLAFDESSGGASLALRSPGGTFEVDTLLWSWTGASAFRSSGVRLRIHDLAAWSGEAALTGHLEADAGLEGRGLAHLGGQNGGTRALRDGRVRATARVRLAASSFRGREVRGGAVAFSLSEGRLTLEGDLDSDAGRMVLEADARPFDARPVERVKRLRFDEVDVGAWLGNAALRSRVTGTLSGESRRAVTSGPGRPHERRWQASLHLEGEHVGPLAFTSGQLQAEGRGADSRVHGIVHVRGGTVQLESKVIEAGAASTASARLDVPLALLPALFGRDTLVATGALRLELDTRGSLRDPPAMTASGQLHGSGTVARARLDSLLLAFHLERGLVTVDTMSLRSNAATARASGRFALVDPPHGGPPERDVQLRVQAEWRDPSLLAPLLGADTLSVASGGTQMEVAGPARDRAFTLRSDLRTLVWDDVRVRHAVVDARGRLGTGTRLRELEASGRAEWMTFGDLRVPLARLQVRGDSSRLQWLADGRFRDRDSLSLAGSFRPDSSGWALGLARFALLSDSAQWRLVETTELRVRGARYELDPLHIASTRGRVEAKGVIDRAGTQDFQLELRDVGLGVLTSLRDLGEVDGRWSASLAVTGPAATPRARGDVRAAFLAGGRPVGSLGADYDWTHDGFGLSGGFANPAGDSLVVASHLPIAFSLVPRAPGAAAAPRLGSGQARLRVRAARFPLASLQPLLAHAGVGVLDGVLEMDLRLSGRGEEFRGDGHGGVSGGRLELPALGLKASELGFHGAWNGDRLVLEEFHALTGKGRLDADGSLRIASLTRMEPDLRLRAERAVLTDTKQLKLVASGDLTMRGTITAPEFRGRLRFGGSHLLVAPETFASAEKKAEIPLSADDLRMLEETFTYVQPVTPDPLIAIYDASDLDFTIALDRNNWIRQAAEPRLSVEVFGEVRMTKKPGGEPLLVGRLEPLPGRGYLEQFGRSFALTGGEVLLNGAMSSHTLNLKAQYPSERDAMSREENDVVVHLDLEGTLERMRLVLSSVPALSETEIITFIATGRSPTTRTGQSQSLGSDAAKLGMDMGLAKVSGALEDVAQRSVGLDVLKVGYDGIQGTTLIAGRYVAPQLYVGFRQPLQTLNNSGTSLDEDNDTKVELEYAAYRWLVLNVQGESSFIRSYLRFRREY